MSAGGYVRRGLCPQGVMSAGGFIQGVMSAGGFVRRGLCPRFRSLVRPMIFRLTAPNWERPSPDYGSHIIMSISGIYLLISIHT